MRNGLLAVVIGVLVLAGAGVTRADQVGKNRKRKAKRAPVAVALVIDRSGSMSGLKLDQTKLAVGAAVNALPAKAQVGVIAFDTQARVVVPLQSKRNRARIQAAVAKVQAGGGTHIHAALSAAHSMLAFSAARRRHVILLSDGQAPYSGIEALAKKMRADQITISTIAIGDADQKLLSMIANHGTGRFYFTPDPRKLPRVFAREAALADKQPKPSN